MAQTSTAGLDGASNPMNTPQQEGAAGPSAITFPQKSPGTFPEYVDPGAWEFPSSDLE